METRQSFSTRQIQVVNDAVDMSEELVSNHYKLSANQWHRLKYDIKTLANLSPDEIVEGPFAQIVRYVGQLKDRELGSSAYDFYKICIQDHSVLTVVKGPPLLRLLPFALYIVTHELIHIIRFQHFLQSFDASETDKLKEETRVHEKTYELLRRLNMDGMGAVLEFYAKWQQPFDRLLQT